MRAKSIMLTRPLVLEAFCKAADWLEANPDKHTKGVMARDAEGTRVEPNAPEATCFCMYGRMLHELGLAEIEGNGIDDNVRIINDIVPASLHFGIVAGINDRRLSGGNVVINYVREKASC